MRRNNPFDKLLAKAFFKPPKKAPQVQLDFPVPERKETLQEFFTHQGKQYREGVAGLATQLKSLAEKQKILDGSAESALALFLEKIDLKPGASPFHINKVFPLFTQGVNHLAEIIAILSRKQEWSETEKDLIKNLMHHMNKCEDEVYTTIYDTWLALSPDLQNRLMSIRRTLATKVAQEVVVRQDEQYGGPMEIAFGSDTHYRDALLNEHHKLLGVELVEDELSKLYMPTPKMKQLFKSFVFAGLDAEYVIDSLMQRDREIFAIKKPDAGFFEWLTRFGSDAHFSADQLATLDEENNYQFKPRINYYLRHAIFMRLANSGYFDASQMIKHDASIPGAVVYMPPADNIRLANLTFTQTDLTAEPLVLFYLQRFYAEAQAGGNETDALESLCDTDQRQELTDEVARLISADWPELIKKLSADEQLKLLMYFNKKFPTHYLSLMEMLNISNLSGEAKQALVSQFELRDKVSHANNLSKLLAYLDLFPPDRWLPMLTDELQDMDLLGHRPVTKVVTTLALAERLSINNIRQILSLFTGQKEDGDFSIASLTSLLGMFSTDRDRELCQYLIDRLLAAGKDAWKLAKAIWILNDAGMLNDETMAFIEKHAVEADSLAAMLIIFHKKFAVDVDSSLFLFLANYTGKAEKFLEYRDDPGTKEWFYFLLNVQLLDFKRVKRLFKRAQNIKEAIAALAGLYQLNPHLCAESADLLIKHAGHLDMLNIIRRIVDHCHSRKINFNKAWLEAIVQHEDEFPPYVDDATLAYYAAMCGMTELLESMINSGTVSVTQKSPTFPGMSLLIVATINGQQEICQLLQANGAKLDDPVTIKIAALQDAFPEDKQDKLIEFCKAKLDVEQPEPDSEITVTAKELAALVATLANPAPSVSPLRKLSKFSTAAVSETTETDNPDPNAPGFDK